MKVQSTIQKWGNSLALRLTGPIRSIPQLEANMIVDIEIAEDCIKIYPAKKQTKKLPFSEKDLLKGLNANSAHADEVANLSDKEIGE